MRTTMRGATFVASTFTVLTGLVGVGCIVPAEPGFSTQRLERESLTPSRARNTSWHNAQAAAAQERPDVVDLAVGRPATESAPANATPGDESMMDTGASLEGSDAPVAEAPMGSGGSGESGGSEAPEGTASGDDDPASVAALDQESQTGDASPSPTVNDGTLDPAQAATSSEPAQAQAATAPGGDKLVNESGSSSGEAPPPAQTLVKADQETSAQAPGAGSEATEAGGQPSLDAEGTTLAATEASAPASTEATPTEEPAPPDPALVEAAAALEEPPPPSDLLGLTSIFRGTAGAPSYVEDLVMSAEEGRVLVVRLRSGKDTEALDLPFDAFRFDETTRTLELRADLADVADERTAGAETSSATATPYVELFADAEATPFVGDVLAIELSRPENIAEDYVFLKVRDENNHLQRVLLGPVWFVMPNTWLSTGETASVRGVTTRDARGALLVAQEAQLGATRLLLRHDDGRPHWMDPDPETPELTRVPMHGLLAREIHVDGEVWGNATDIVIEGRSGAVRFLCLRSVVEELAGRWIVVPWSRVTLADGLLRLDVGASTLGAAPSISAGNVADLADEEVRERIRRYFETEEG